MFFYNWPCTYGQIQWIHFSRSKTLLFAVWQTACGGSVRPSHHLQHTPTPNPYAAEADIIIIINIVIIITVAAEVVVLEEGAVFVSLLPQKR